MIAALALTGGTAGLVSTGTAVEAIGFGPTMAVLVGLQALATGFFLVGAAGAAAGTETGSVPGPAGRSDRLSSGNGAA